MYEIARKALKSALEAGADEAEVYMVGNDVTGIDIRKGVIESSRQKINQGMGIRAVVNGAVGFASTNVESRMEDSAKIAVISAKIRGHDPEWKSLPTEDKYTEIKGTFDSAIEKLELDECIELTNEMLQGAASMHKILVTSGSFSRIVSRRLIVNSNGIEIEDAGTAISGFVDIITNEGEPTTAYDYDMSRQKDIDFSKIGENAANLAVMSKNGISIEPQKTEIIMHPFAVSDLIVDIFSSSIDADNVQKGRSSLAGKIGTVIANEDLSINDDGLLEGGMETSMADDEGVPSHTTSVIDKGVLKSYLYDTYTAGKDNTKSTGNSIRHSYAGSPSIGTRNFIIDYKQSDLISDTDKGIFINTVIGAHTANSISGDFSVEARNAFTIEKGQLVSPIKSLMVSGNVFDILKNINGAGKDIKKIGGTVTPSLRIENMSVVG